MGLCGWPMAISNTFDHPKHAFNLILFYGPPIRGLHGESLDHTFLMCSEIYMLIIRNYWIYVILKSVTIQFYIRSDRIVTSELFFPFEMGCYLWSASEFVVIGWYDYCSCNMIYSCKHCSHYWGFLFCRYVFHGFHWATSSYWLCNSAIEQGCCV